MKLYMKVTADDYEFPLLIEDNLERFCQKLGISKDRCWQIMCRETDGSRRGYKIRKVEIEQEE